MTAHYAPPRIIDTVAKKRREKKRADKLAELQRDVLAATPDKSERKRRDADAFRAQGERP